MNDKECIEKFLIYNASLVISAVKPSATITIKKGNNGLYDKWIRYGVDFLNSIDLGFINLRESDEALIVLVYNDSELQKYIFNKEVNRFLIKLGYPRKNNVYNYILNLKVRYEKFKCPHELGVFLGFPLNDVKDFMQCTNKKCLGCGYWRVYNDFNRAKEVFLKYDKIKDEAIKNILTDDNTYNIVNNIRILADKIS